MEHELYLKNLIRKTIRVYQTMLEDCKTEGLKGKPIDLKQTGYYTGILFGLKEGLETWNEKTLDNMISEKQEAYKKQEDKYVCGFVEGLSMVLRIMQHDEKMHDAIGLLIGSYEFGDVLKSNKKI